jgi:hypothetical protein
LLDAAIPPYSTQAVNCKQFEENPAKYTTGSIWSVRSHGHLHYGPVTVLNYPYGDRYHAWGEFEDKADGRIKQREFAVTRFRKIPDNANKPMLVGATKRR